MDHGAGAIIGMFFMVFGLIYLAIVVVVLVSLWKTFTKAGKPGWAAIIPIYNIVVLMEIIGKPAWWVILFFIPLVNLIVGILCSIALAESFGKSAGFGIGIALLGIIFLPILAFGDAQYAGPRPATSPVGI